MRRRKNIPPLDPGLEEYMPDLIEMDIQPSLTWLEEACIGCLFETRKKKLLVAYVLTFFFGIFGAQHFYLRKYVLGTIFLAFAIFVLLFVGSDVDKALIFLGVLCVLGVDTMLFLVKRFNECNRRIFIESVNEVLENRKIIRAEGLPMTPPLGRSSVRPRVRLDSFMQIC